MLLSCPYPNWYFHLDHIILSQSTLYVVWHHRRWLAKDANAPMITMEMYHPEKKNFNLL
jgi:hypothetical protein